MSTKDYFSGHSKLYATFRPTYPQELYDFIFSHVKTFDTAWDCATGNGQVAGVVANYFKEVRATDISLQQLDHAVKAKNILYSQQPAEKTNFANHTVDLVTVAQALHWLSLPAFYSEVNRVTKPGGILAVWGYAVCSVTHEINSRFYEFYNKTVGPYWDNARKIVDDEYASIHFPVSEIQAPKFSIKLEWTAEQFGGYLTTWSATQKFIAANGYDPVPAFMNTIRPYWPANLMVTFPLFVRVARVN